MMNKSIKSLLLTVLHKNTSQIKKAAIPILENNSSDKDLQRILSQHKKWLKTGGKKGCRADLSHAALQSVNLKGANLKYATL